MAEELRERLRTVDASAPSIQGAANAMMKHYDRATTSIAVNEWRNALFTTTATTQYIPLLYVANEVLQNSKRNRGNKFLESFSPILSQSSIYMVQQLHQHSSTTAVQDVEKIRRVIKIWSDRRVFSTRYVNEVLAGLEPYRTVQQSYNQPAPSSSSSSSSPTATTVATATMHLDDLDPPATFSPPVGMQDSIGNSGRSTNLDDSHQSNQSTVSHEDILGILEAHEQGKYSQPSNEQNDLNEDYDGYDDDEDDDDDDLFADNANNDDSIRGNGSLQLSIDMNVTHAVANLASENYAHRNNKRQRRRSSTASAAGANGSRAERRSSNLNSINSPKSILSNVRFLEIWNQLVENEQKYDIAMNTIRQINTNIDTISNDELSNLVGDALQQAVQQNEMDLKRMVQQKRILHALANQRHTLGLEAMRYIPWIEASIHQDIEDIQFSTVLQEKIRQFLPICKQLQATRNVVRQEQQRLDEINAEKVRRQTEAEENERFKRDILAMQTEAKPGMVWNPTTREYQALNTDESWRD
jgi:CID domain